MILKSLLVIPFVLLFGALLANCGSDSPESVSIQELIRAANPPTSTTTADASTNLSTAPSSTPVNPTTSAATTTTTTTTTTTRPPTTTSTTQRSATPGLTTSVVMEPQAIISLSSNCEQTTFGVSPRYNLPIYENSLIECEGRWKATQQIQGAYMECVLDFGGAIENITPNRATLVSRTAYTEIGTVYSWSIGLRVNARLIGENCIIYSDPLPDTATDGPPATNIIEPEVIIGLSGNCEQTTFEISPRYRLPIYEDSLIECEGRWNADQRILGAYVECTLNFDGAAEDITLNRAILVKRGDFTEIDKVYPWKISMRTDFRLQGQDCAIHSDPRPAVTTTTQQPTTTTQQPTTTTQEPTTTTQPRSGEPPIEISTGKLN